MASNIRIVEDCIQPLVPELSKPTEWEKLVKKEVLDGTLKGRTCRIYSAAMNRSSDEETRCVCGRLARRHSYTGVPETTYQNSQRWESRFAVEVDLTTYGLLENGARVCYRLRTVSNMLSMFSSLVYSMRFTEAGYDGKTRPAHHSWYGWNT